MRFLGIGLLVVVIGCQSTPKMGEYQKTELEKRIAYLSTMLKKSIVNLQMVKEYYAGGKKQRISSLCSGSIISEDGLIITNYHCVGDAKRIWVTLWNKKKVEAELVGEDAWTDLGLIRLKKSDKLKNVKLVPMRLGKYEDIVDGDYVFALGSPMGFSQTVTLGIVANKRRVLSLDFESNMDVGQSDNPIVHWIHHTAPIYGGNSGGPLVNMKGEQIGVNARGATGGFSLAIPADVVQDVVARLLKYGKPNWAYYGWTLSELSDELKELNKLPEDAKGVFISDIVEGSPAYLAGVRSGDILLEIDNREVSATLKEEVPPILKILAGKPLMKPFPIKIRRSTGEIFVTPVVPEEWELWEIPPMATWTGMQREKDFYASDIYGFSAQKIVKKVAVKEKFTEPWGVLVEGVVVGSIASNAGLLGKDIIKYVNDKPITDIETFKKIMSELEKERPEKVKITVMRNNAISYVFFKDREKLIGGK